MLSVLQVLADAGVQPGNGPGYRTGIPKVEFTAETVTTLLQITFAIVGAVALLIIVIAGLKYVTSQGDPQSTGQARNAIIYAAIGLVIALSAEIIVTFVVRSL